MTALLIVWKFLAGIGRAAFSWFADLPPQIKIALACIVVLTLWTWLVNDRAYSRGEAAGLAERAEELRLCTDNVTALETGIASANETAERAAREATERAADANRAAQASMGQTEQKRAQEARRGPGAEQMNAFLRETFQ